MDLAKRGFCSDMAPYRIQEIGTRGKGRCIGLQDPNGERLVVSITNISSLADAKLRFNAEVDRKGRLVHYTVSIEGLRTATSPPESWYARIDLAIEEPRIDHCRHPRLHCHIGIDPERNREQPDVRVPLPWLAPDEALTWILATIDARLEPLHPPPTNHSP